MKLVISLVVIFALAVQSYAFYLGRDSVSDDGFDGRDSFVNESSITYQVFTRRNPTIPQLITVGDLEALEQSNFDPNLPTKAFAHGWRGDPGSGYSMRDGYLTREDCNFIAVDWSDMASGPLPYPSDYPYIVEVNVPKVGKNLGALVDFIIERTGAPLNSFHLIGWSLGAHVVGYAGAAVTTGKLTRITGLDPAGPFFPLNDTSSRLDSSDAEFVDTLQQILIDFRGLKGP